MIRQLLLQGSKRALHTPERAEASADDSESGFDM